MDATDKMEDYQKDNKKGSLIDGQKMKSIGLMKEGEKEEGKLPKCEKEEMNEEEKDVEKKMKKKCQQVKKNFYIKKSKNISKKKELLKKKNRDFKRRRSSQN